MEKKVKNSKKEYSKNSPILKAYSAGMMPPDHLRLFNALKEVLGEGNQEGVIHLEDALIKTGYFRSSALKMLHHMKNFGVLETESRYRGTWVKLLKS